MNRILNLHPHMVLYLYWEDNTSRHIDTTKTLVAQTSICEIPSNYFDY